MFLWLRNFSTYLRHKVQHKEEDTWYSSVPASEYVLAHAFLTYPSLTVILPYNSTLHNLLIWDSVVKFILFTKNNDLTARKYTVQITLTCKSTMKGTWQLNNVTTIRNELTCEWKYSLRLYLTSKCCRSVRNPAERLLKFYFTQNYKHFSEPISIWLHTKLTLVAIVSLITLITRLPGERESPWWRHQPDIPAHAKVNCPRQIWHHRCYSQRWRVKFRRKHQTVSLCVQFLSNQNESFSKLLLFPSSDEL
jgi:hypothetical protein